MKQTKQYFSIGILASAICLTGMACSEKKTEPAQTFFDTINMDGKTSPGKDFYTYANGHWLKTAVIPDDLPAWGSFYTLYTETLGKQKSLLEEMSKNAGQVKGSDAQKVGDFYASGMDTVAIDKAGYTPLVGKLKAIEEAADYKALLDFLATDSKEGFGDLIGNGVAPDDKNSNLNIMVMVQSGLSLPEKGYYTGKDESTKNIRDKFVEHAKKLFMLRGDSEASAAAKAKTVLALETKIAAYHLSPEELRDPIKNYNKMSLDQLQKVSPSIDWKSQFEKMGFVTDSVNVSQPLYYKGLSKLLQSEPLTDWKAKVSFDYLNDHAEYLSKPFRDANFEFNKLFTGAQAQRARWKIMVSETDQSLGELFGKVYVEKYFTPEARKRMDKLVNNLQTAFRKRMQNLSWMSADTRAKGIAKLDAIIKKIGYPDKWKNYDDVQISRDNYFQNLVSVWRHRQLEQMAKLNKQVDKTEWQMTPPTINAYYNPSFNEIVFPAGILQFPFFHPDADDAINYGAIGMVIGHEMTHGFDDQGKQYDAAGNLNNWWTDEDAKKFSDASAKLVAQYSNFTVLDSLHINGKLTLGENIADLGGLFIAYDAFKLTEQGKSSDKIDGFTPDQRFFLGFAQVWRLVTKPEMSRMQVRTDPHSPPKFRVNGPLMHFNPFYEAFSIKKGDAMYLDPADRVMIW
jgi:putative endopeptidase